MAARAVVLGASGFAGGELLRLLAGHPGIELEAAAASSRVGEPVSDSYPGLGYEGINFSSAEAAAGGTWDILFASLPHTESMKVLGGLQAGKIVDLGGDFRLREPGLYEQWYGQAHAAPQQLGAWVYGLTEFHRAQITEAQRVANPGCYPAASVLALQPLLRAGLIEAGGIHIDALSGVSGAGRASGEVLDFASANENSRPYAPTGHKHIPEIEQELSDAAAEPVTISFVPHLVPMTRGILVSAAANAKGAPSDEDLNYALESAYANEPFIRVTTGGALPQTKHLAGTNFAEVAVRLDARTGRVLAFAALDNLGKGAAGQALQNANLMLGFDETTGLEAHAVFP